MSEARIVDGKIVIEVAIDALPQVVDGAWALQATDVFQTRWKVTDGSKLAEEIVRELNSEDEQGTTMVHHLFDRAISDAIEQGAEGIEEHEIQDA